jgi:hypothetical protein
VLLRQLPQVEAGEEVEDAARPRRRRTPRRVNRLRQPRLHRRPLRVLRPRPPLRAVLHQQPRKVPLLLRPARQPLLPLRAEAVGAADVDAAATRPHRPRRGLRMRRCWR